MGEIGDLLESAAEPAAGPEGPIEPGWGPDYDEPEHGYNPGTGIYAGDAADYKPEEAVEDELDAVSNKYGMPNYFDDVMVDDLGGGAVAAAAHVPSAYNVEEVDDIYDSLEYESMMVDEDGQLYGLDVYDWDTVFIADEEEYFSKNPEQRELVNFHELQHGSQYNGQWGSDLDDVLDLDSGTESYLNQFGKDTPTPILEGMTQYMTEKAIPDGEQLGQGYYDAETRMAEMDLWSKGLISDPGRAGKSREQKWYDSPVEQVVEVVFETVPVLDWEKDKQYTWDLGTAFS